MNLTAVIVLNLALVVALLGLFAYVCAIPFRLPAAPRTEARRVERRDGERLAA